MTSAKGCPRKMQPVNESGENRVGGRGCWD